MPIPPVIVTFALPQESSDFRLAMEGKWDRAIRIEHIGVGPEAAARNIRRVLALEKPRLVICTGFAGGLDPRLAPADLVVAENLSTAEALVRARSQIGPHVVLGTVLSRATAIETVADKTALHRETGAHAVDMESETVAAACRAAGVPLLAVRTISDPAGAPLPVPFGEWFDLQRQCPRPFGLVKYLLFHPTQIGPFARFVRGLAPARRALAEFLIQFLAHGEH
jgi:nucleoside phosphorylase